MKIQYQKYVISLKLNGINTQGENIADNGGIKESYLAYQRWVDENEPEPRLPGLDYTPQQLFWVSAAQTWCSVYRPGNYIIVNSKCLDLSSYNNQISLESMKMRITTGVHSPAQFRVLGPFSNMKDFARDFNCPEGSPMNPVNKCEVW